MKRFLPVLVLAWSSPSLAQASLAHALDPSGLDAPKLLETLAQQPSPEPFLQELYRELQQTPTPDAFSGGDGASRIYGKPLLTSVHKEFWGARQSLAGQLGYAPLCVCQDPTAFNLSPIVLTPIDKSHTDAVFTLHFEPRPTPGVQAPTQDTTARASPTAFPEAPGPTPDTRPTTTPPDRIITLHLVRGEHGWRVDDIATREVPSMKFLLHQRNPESAEEAAASQSPQRP